MSYRTFISYAREDERWAAWLQRRLERWRPPRAMKHLPAPGPIFRDREGFAASSDLSQSIRAALEASQRMVVVCSGAAAASHWVEAEVQNFVDLGRRDKILCLFVGDADIEAQLPAPLLGADDDVPLGADPRASGDGRELALLKIIAGLLDVDLETLRRRDIQRRNRRLALISTASLAGMTLMTAVTLFALVSRNSAIEAREEAEIRQHQAENLITFMIGDLRTKLETVGRLDILREVGTEAARYFATGPADSLSDAELHQRAKAIRQFGTDRLVEGDVDEALNQFRTALEFDEALTARGPDQVEWAVGEADSHYWIGVVHYQRDELQSALEAFRSQSRALQRVAAHFPKNLEVRVNLAYARNNLGMIQRQQGDLKAALTSIGDARDALREATDSSSDVEHARTVADFTVTLGELKWRIGDLQEAHADLVEAVAALEQLRDSHPTDVLIKESLTAALAYLLRVDDARDGLDTESLANRLLALAEERLRIDEAVVDARRDVAVAQRLVAAELVDRKRESEAIEYAKKSVETLSQLSELDLSDLQRLRDLVESELLLASVLEATGDLQQARILLEKSRERLVDGEEFEPGEDETSRLVWRSALQLGRVLVRLGMAEEAEAVWLRALAELDERVASGDGPLLALRAALLSNLGERDGAAAQRAQLVARGWSEARLQRLAAVDHDIASSEI